MKTVTDDVLLGNVRRQPVVFERGEGVRLYDTDGKPYLDLLAGIAVSLLGHAHPALTEAVSSQAGRLLHSSNLFYNAPALQAARLLVDRLGPGRVYFSNSGTEANEAAIKLARKRASRAGDPERTRIVAVEGSFHGRTLGALSVTIQPGKQEGFGPLPGDVVTVPFDDVEALEEAVTDRTAAVMLEPIQGEIGIRPMSPRFVDAARRLCTERGALLVADEIQTGLGRTGQWWDLDHYGVRADVVTLAKGLGAGVPIGAMWVTEEHAGALQPGDHGTTQGGNPLSCAAAVCVLETIERDDLIANARAVGEVLRAGLEPLGIEVRGRGLLLALDLGRPVAADVVGAALGAGLIVNAVNPTSIRIAPPLIITADEAREGLELLGRAIEAVG